MRITGYQLREAIRRWELRRDAASSQFERSLWRFADEDKPSPDDLYHSFERAERAIARLQAAQARYNLAIVVEVLDERITLCEAVKRVGGAARAARLWKDLLEPGNTRHPSLWRYLDPKRHGVPTRDKDREEARPALPTRDLVERATKAATRAGALRAAIAEANARPIDLEELESSLLE